MHPLTGFVVGERGVRGGVGGVISEGTYNWKRKRASKQAMAMLIKVRFATLIHRE